MNDLVRKLGAEFAGTAILVFFGVGSAVFGFDKIGAAGVALPSGSSCSRWPTPSARCRAATSTRPSRWACCSGAASVPRGGRLLGRPVPRRYRRCGVAS